MMRALKHPRRARWLTGLVAACLFVGVGVGVAVADPSFTRSADGTVTVPTETSCPTLTATPRAFEAWVNTDDMELRGLFDSKNQTAWSFMSRMAQVICGAKNGASVRIGYYFIRALGTMTPLSLGSRPESDPEAIWDALEYVHRERGVSVEIIIDSSTNYSVQWEQIKQRLVDTGIAKVKRCVNGCFNTNRGSAFPTAINHEKYITISDTVWPNAASGSHPMIIQGSGNIARSQVRNYLQEATLVYDDHRMFDLLMGRHNDMWNCVTTGCATRSGFSSQFRLVKQRGIWVDPIHRHGTDAGRGTLIGFAPQPLAAFDYYVEQFDDVDCTVDGQIRIAMFKLGDTKSLRMVESLVRLKKRGCDIKLLMSRSYGSYVFSTAVRRLLVKNKIPFTCSPAPMHTKLILIGPASSNNGRILVGTANMTTSGLRYNEEHLLTIDSRRSSPPFTEDIRRAYGDYMNAFAEMSEGGVKCS